VLHAILAFSGVHHPTPIKYAWLILTAASLSLRLLAIWMIGFPAFRVYMLATIGATILQNSRFWGLSGELALASMLMLFAGEILWFSEYGVKYAMVRHYNRQFSVLIAMAIFGVVLLVAPPPYFGYPESQYYLRLYSTTFALAITNPFSTRSVLPQRLRYHNLIAAVWLAAIVGSGIIEGVDRWTLAIASTSVQVGCLIAWITVAAIMRQSPDKWPQSPSEDPRDHSCAAAPSR
jgi:hypothetical protein